MIRPDRLKNALLALNHVLVIARTMAYQKANHDDLATVLDDAEILPTMILRDADMTEDYRLTLVGLAERCPAFRSALQKFDGEAPGQGAR